MNTDDRELLDAEVVTVVHVDHENARRRTEWTRRRQHADEPAVRDRCHRIVDGSVERREVVRTRIRREVRVVRLATNRQLDVIPWIHEKGTCRDLEARVAQKI